MKKIVYTLAAFFAASFAFVACQQAELDKTEKEEPKSEDVVVPTDDNATKTYTFSIVESQDEATKTIIGTDGVNKFAKWEDNDELAYLINDNGSTYSYVEVAGDDVTFTVTGDLEVGDMLFAWYPNFEATTSSSTEAKFNIPYAQYQDVTTGYDLDAFPMVAKPTEVTAAMLAEYDPEVDNDKPLADVRFANLGSLINFKVFSSRAEYQSEKVISVTFDAGTDIIAGTYSKELMDVDFSDESTLSLRSSQSDAPLADGSSIITTTLSAEQVLTSHTDKASALDVYMTVIPGSYAGRVVVLTDKASYTFKISTAKEFARGAINTLGLDLNKVGTTAIRTTPYNFNLAAASYASASEDQVRWESEIIDIISDKIGTNTKANNYLPTSQSSSRFYSGNKLTFSPQNDAKILKVKYTATTEGYATAMANSTWTNAGAIADSKIVTIVPEQIGNDFYATLGGTSGSTGIDVYYYGGTEWVVKSIAVTTNPTKTSYVYGETFDPTGMVVKATYEDAADDTKTKVVTLTSGDYTISPAGPLAMSDDEVTISFNGKNTSVGITMSKATPSLTVTPSGTINLTVGENQQLAVSGTDGDITYTSDASAIASVSTPGGLISAVSAGNATITISAAASANYNSASTTVDVHVNAALAFETIIVDADWVADLKTDTGNNAKFVDDGQSIWKTDATYGHTIQDATPATFYSPIFDMSGVTEGQISFKHTGNLTGSSYATLGTAYYKLNDGSWTEIDLTAPTSKWEWETATIESSVYTGKTIQFKWESGGISESKWEIKDFAISTSAPKVWKLTPLANITASDVFVIVGTTSTKSYALVNNNGTSSAPAAVVITTTTDGGGNTILTETPADNLKWHMTVSTGNYTFYPGVSGTSSWLYCTNSNDGVRVGTGTNKTFSIEDGYLKNTGNSRFVGVYTKTPDWRCYTSKTGTSNIAGQTFSYYVLQP